MKKKIVLGAVAIVVLVAAAVALLTVTQLDGMVADAVERYGQAATGTEVHLSGVDVALTESRGELKRLTIDNPPGFSTDYALRIDKLEIIVDLSSLSEEVPIITEVRVDDAHVNAEQRGDSTNLGEIQRHMSEPADPPPEGDEAEERIIIDRFRLSNARVSVTSDALGAPEELELDDIVVEGIGRNAGGATYAEAAEAVLDPILGAARAAIQGRVRDAASEAAREAVEEEVDERLDELLDRN